MVFTIAVNPPPGISTMAPTSMSLLNLFSQRRKYAAATSARRRRSRIRGSRELQLLAGDGDHRIVFWVEAGFLHRNRQRYMVGAADTAGEGDLFAFEILQRLVLRRALGSSRRSDPRKTRSRATANR